MGSLEDQLKQWKKTQAAKPPEKASSSSSKSAQPQPQRKAPTKKDPFPKETLREKPKPATPPPPKKSDAELFAEAVARVDEDVVLEKFAQSSSSSSSSKQSKSAPPPLTDEELFKSFVGEKNVAAEADGGNASKLVRLKK